MKLSTRLTLSLLLAFGYTVDSEAFQQQQNLSGWTPYAPHSDEFNDGTFDSSKWYKADSNPIGDVRFGAPVTASSIHRYNPGNVTQVGDGNLVIRTEALSFPFDRQMVGGPEIKYSSGQIISLDEKQYGRWDVRANLPDATDSWPAIWLIPNEFNQPPLHEDSNFVETGGGVLWPNGGEIDIMEHRGQEGPVVSSAINYGQNDPDPFMRDFRAKEFSQTINGVSTDFNEGFHTYSLEWVLSNLGNTQLHFFVDGVRYHSLYSTDTSDGGAGSTLGDEILDQLAMQLRINTAVGGEFFPGGPSDDPSEFPQTMEIDYSRAYTKTGTPTNTFQNGDFETENFDGNGVGSFFEWSHYNTQGEIHNFSISSAAGSVGVDGLDDGNDAAARLTSLAAGSDPSTLSQAISVNPGELVEVSAFSKILAGADSLNGGDEQLLMLLSFFDETGLSELYQTPLSQVGGVIRDGQVTMTEGIWEQHLLSAIAPAGSVEAVLSFQMAPVAGGGVRAVYIDGVSFLAVPEPATYILYGLLLIPLSFRKRKKSLRIPVR